MNKKDIIVDLSRLESSENDARRDREGKKQTPIKQLWIMLTTREKINRALMHRVPEGSAVHGWWASPENWSGQRAGVLFHTQSWGQSQTDQQFRSWTVTHISSPLEAMAEFKDPLPLHLLADDHHHHFLRTDLSSKHPAYMNSFYRGGNGSTERGSNLA